MKIRTSFLLLILVVFLNACNKSEGPGGMATIKGKLYVKQYVGGVLTSEYYGADYDVYIIYGDGSNFYDDNVKTSYDGSFEFRYLRKGTYRVFAYSDDAAAASGVSPVIQTVEITDKKGVVELDDIVIKD